VYLKLNSCTDPGRMVGVQFAFGQPTGAPAKLTDRPETRNCPFLVDAIVAVSVGENAVVCDSIGFCGFVPGLKQSTIAV
jgi:hypothetical protein